MSESFEPDRLLRLQSAISLRRHEGIKKALNWFRDNPNELKQRIDEFDSVLLTLRDRMTHFGIDWSKYQHADKLLDAIGENDLPPTLRVVSDLVANNQGKGLIQTIQSTFAKVDDLLSTDWAWAGSLDPQRTASGLLIEGFGLMMEDNMGVPGLRRIFVEAFEEELILNHKDSPLLKDVIGWMQEEKAGFSPVVQKEIDSVQSSFTT